MKRWVLTVVANLSVVLAVSQPSVHIAKYYGNCKAALTFTFDDGLEEHYTAVFPQLKRFGLKASFGIIGSKVGRDHKGIRCMTWEQLREMSADGQEITSHGFHHLSHEKLTGEALRYEVQHNDTLIYSELGVFPRTYFYPGNRKTEEGVKMCSKDRVGTRMFQLSFGSKRDSLWVESTLNRILKNGEWVVLMTHGINVGYDAFSNSQLLWNTMNKVSALKNSIWVATFHDVAAYVAERDTISLDIQHDKGDMTVTLRNPLDKKIFFQPLTLVVSAEVSEVKQGRRKLKFTYKGGKTLFDFDPNGDKILIKLKK